MASPSTSDCNFDFFISNVYSGKLEDLGVITDAHRNATEITESIKKLNTDVVVYEISYKTTGTISGFQFKMPFGNLGLPDDCKNILAVVGGFNGVDGHAKAQQFRLYNYKDNVYGVFNPINSSAVPLGSSSSKVLCYVVVGGKGCSLNSSAKTTTILEEQVATADANAAPLADANSNWFLSGVRSNFWFESELNSAIRMSYEREFSDKYSSVNQKSKISLPDVVAIVYKAHNNFNNLDSDAVVPAFSCASTEKENNKNVFISCVESYPSRLRSIKEKSGFYGCSEEIYEDTSDYSSSNDLSLLLERDVEPHDFKIKVKISSDVSVAGVQFDLGYNYYSKSPGKNQSIKVNSSISDDWFSDFISISDRFGFDQVTRIMSFQKPTSTSKRLADVVSDKESLTKLFTESSIPPVDDYQILEFCIKDCIPDGCKSPEVIYKIKQDSYTVSNQTFAAGTRYYGNVVYYDDNYWTTTSGKWTPTSMLLEKSWQGVELFNIRVVTNDSREFLEHYEQNLSYKGKELFYSQAISSHDYSNYSDFYEETFRDYIKKSLYNGLDSNPTFSAYSYLSTASGFDIDSNLDGRFDVADLVAFTNLSQMRMSLPFNGGTFDASSSSVVSKSDNNNRVASSDGVGFWNLAQLDSLTTARELDRIVPSYSQNNEYRTSTYPSICPSVHSLEDQGSKVMLYLSQRTDILPDKAASAEIEFRGVGVDAETITLTDWDGVTRTYEFESAAGVSGSNVSVTIGGSASATATNFKNAIDGDGTHGSSFTTAISGAKVTITSVKKGERGNKPITYSTNSLQFLRKFPDSLTEGSNYLTTLPPEFKDWYRYQKDIYSIPYKTAPDVRTLQNGGSLFEVKMHTSNKEINFIDHVRFTLNICSGYGLGDNPVTAKVILNDSFKSLEVYKKDKVTPISANADGSYTFPASGDASEGEIHFLCRVVSGTTSVENNAIPITYDGGAFKVATVLLDKNIEGLREETVTLSDGHIHFRKRPKGTYDEKAGLLVTDITEINYNSGNGDLVLGPPSSILLQNYADNSSSTHTYSDYVLHTSAIGTNVIDIIYNSKKQFRRFNFAIRTWNSAKWSSFVTNVGVKSLNGWNIAAQNSTDSNGEDIILITGFSGNYAAPRNLIGKGLLCRIILDKDVFEQSIISSGQSLVCPPIGQSNNLFIPNLDSSFQGEKDYLSNWNVSSDNIIQTNQGASQRFGTQVNDKSLIQICDASKTFEDSVDVDASSNITKWVSQGLDLVPHSNSTTYSPTRGSDHVSFSGAQGLTSNTETYVRTKNITTWMASVVVEPAMPTSPDEGVVFTTIGTNVSTTQPQISLRFDTTSNGSLIAKCVTTSGGTITITHNYSSLSDLRTKQVVTFLGEAGGDCKLYLNGALVGTDVSNSITSTLTDNDFGWALGYDGSGNPASGTKGFNGKIYEFLFYSDSVTDNFRQKSEAYLAMKFGLKSSLPSTHVGSPSDFTYETLRNSDPETRFAINKFDDHMSDKTKRSSRCGAKWVSSRVSIDKDINYLFNSSDDPTGGLV